MSTTTAQLLIDTARVRHWSFIEVELADGAAVLWLNQRQRYLLLKFRDALRGLVGSSVQTAATVAGVLVGVDANGTPYYVTTAADGWAVQINGNGTPYIDTSLPQIAKDPFGQSGGTPGWPLPVDAIALLAMTATTNNGTELPITIVDEAERLRTAPTRYLPAFIAGNRIIPIRPPSTLGMSDDWSCVVSVQLSYIGLTSIAALTDPVTIPAPLVEPLLAGMAELFANQSRHCTTPERAAFREAARRAETEIAQSAFDILGDFQTTTVIYEG